MEKKIGDILEAFQNHRFEDALRQIEQLIKKIGKDNKKKSTLSQNDDRIIHIIKCGSLASMGRLHQANFIFENYFNDKVVAQIIPDQAFLLSSISEMSYDKKLLNKIQIINSKGKSDIRLQRFMLSNRMFSGVSKSFLKQFVSGKKPQDGLAQIFLEYINQINKVEALEQQYSRDLKILPNKNVNLKMVQLFFMKYLTSIDLAKLQNKKLKQSIIDLKLRLLINGNKIQQAKKYYEQNIGIIQNNFVYLRSIRDSQLNNVQNYRFYIQNCGKMFRRNIQIQNYVPMYDFYDEFLQFFLSQNITNDLSQVKKGIENPKTLQNQAMYNFAASNNNTLLIHYYQSLLTQLNLISKGQKHQVAKKSDYYKISIKGLILQLLKINYQVYKKSTKSQEQFHKQLSNNKNFTQLLDLYFIQFSKTLTYTNQMRDYLPLLETKFKNLFSQITKQNSQYILPKVFQKKDENLILLTNIAKILVLSNKNKFQHWKEVQYWAQLLWKLYRKFIEQVEQSKRRQKGEVFLSDQFIIILADIIIYHLEKYVNFNEQKDRLFLQSVLLNLVTILDHTSEISPFNAYIKLRLIYVCQKLNYFDKLIDVYLSLDIKSVQFQTLGYYFLNPVNNFNLYSQFQNNIIKMVRSYHQNQRQTSQYCLKGLKAGTSNQVFEYFSYQKRLQKSLNKLQLFYNLFIKNKQQPHSQFYLEWIQNKLSEYKKLNKKISFNGDTKTMENILSSIVPNNRNISIEQSCFNQYYGIFNSQLVFELQIKIRRVQKQLIKNITQKNVQSDQKIQKYIKEIQQLHCQVSKAQNFETLFAIQNQYNLIGEYLDKKQTRQKQGSTVKTLTKQILSRQLLFYLKLTELKIKSFYSFKEMIKLIKLTQKNQPLEKSIQQLNQIIFKLVETGLNYFTANLTWRQQIKKCWNLRQTFFGMVKMFNQVDQEANKLKKLPKSSKSIISNFAKALQQMVLTSTVNLKFSQPLAPLKNIINIDLDKKYLDKTVQRDQALKRCVTMDIKQARKFISK